LLAHSSLPLEAIFLPATAEKIQSSKIRTEMARSGFGWKSKNGLKREFLVS
jgi:hypothetical protein